MDEEKNNAEEMKLDALADFHARLSQCESFDVSLSRRITALEKGSHRSSDNPMMDMIWVMAILTALPLVVDLIKQWRSPAA